MLSGDGGFLVYLIIGLITIDIGYNDHNSNYNKYLWTKLLWPFCFWVLVDIILSTFSSSVCTSDRLSKT